MAEASNNVLTVGVSGSVGRQVTFRQFKGKTIMVKKRKKGIGPLTASQLAIRRKFLYSVSYAKEAISVPGIKAAYEAAANPLQSAFNRAFVDAYIEPTVSIIDITNYHGEIGDRIVITATDDYKVTGVEVSILHVEGAMIEQGKAVQQENVNEWLYTATVANATIARSKIIAVATDLPCNKGKLSVTVK